MLDFLLLPFTKVKSQPNQLQKKTGKRNEKISLSEFVVLVQKWAKITAQKKKTKKDLFGLQNSLLIGLGQDQQQHPAVYTGGVSRGRVRDCGCGM